MDEFKFVLRCLLFTMFLLFISQYKWNDETLEAKAEYAFVHSTSAERLREVAAGGVKFIRNAVEEGVSFVRSKMAHNDGGSHHEPSKNKSVLNSY